MNSMPRFLEVLLGLTFLLLLAIFCGWALARVAGGGDYSWLNNGSTLEAVNYGY